MSLARPSAYVLSQGDEVITGQVVDSNASWLSESLTDLGFDVMRRLTVGDRPAHIAQMVDEALSNARFSVCTGGLGPTQDDHTSACVAQVLGQPLELHPPSLERIKAIFQRLNRPMTANNERQAWFPRGAQVLDNDWGTAPGFAVERGGNTAVFLPGVPREMKGLWEHRVLPLLRERFALEPGRLVTLRCLGITESQLAHTLADLDGIDGITLGFRTMLPENQVKFRIAPGVSEERVAQVVGTARERLGRAVFGIDSGNIAEVVGERLVAAGHTLAIAESCTGGAVSAAITAVPGASRYLLESAVVYANEAKVRTCGVSEALIAEHGAVSEPVARAMAEGIRARAGATWGLATTGIAGPGGGSPEKPVGTVHLALAGPDGTRHTLLRLAGDRNRIVSLTVGSAIDKIRRALEEGWTNSDRPPR